MQVLLEKFRSTMNNIKVANPDNFLRVKEKLAKIDYSFLSSVSGVNSWMNQDDINEAYLTQ